MYDELVKRLREQVKCNKKTYPLGVPFETLLLDLAADAIEKLNKQLENETEYATALNCYVPQWIPVTERLPEVKEWVLCYCRANIYEVLKMRTSGDWVHDVHHIYMHNFVTHWMPLPEPPEKESES